MKLVLFPDKSIRFKLMLILGFVLLFFISGYFIFQDIHSRRNHLNQKIQEQELIESINAVIQTRRVAYERTVFDYSVFSWMGDFIQKPDTIEGHATISHPKQLGFSFIQVYNLKKQLVYFDLASPLSDTITIPDQVLQKLILTKSVCVYLRTKYGIVEILGSTVHISNDIEKETPSRGMVFFGKLWDVDYLQSLSKITNSEVELVFPEQFNKKLTSVQIAIDLKNLKYKTIARLIVTKNNPILDSIERLNSYMNIFFVVFCLTIFGLGYVTYFTIVLKPLHKISRTLDSENIRYINSLVGRPNEFGRLSDMIVGHFDQRNQLKESIEEMNSIQQSMLAMNVELSTQKFEIEEQNTRLQSLYQELQEQNQIAIASAENLYKANNEITESIKYASFIQKAVLSPSHELLRFFPEHFIYYRPKHIISGDFYWFKALKNGGCILAVADCTGHGLSGSLLSMLGISYLNEITAQLEGESYTASDILNSLRRFLIASLHQQESDHLQDGMDIVLCIFDKDMHQVQYSSAFHNFFIIRKNIEGVFDLLEFKGNRLPLGIFKSNQLYTDYTVALQNNDQLYFYSDGIVDQFGGAHEKKFMTTNFKKLLLSFSHKPLDQQKLDLSSNYKAWRGGNEQTDDIVVVGVKVKQLNSKKLS